MSLKEKVLGLNVMERRVMTAETALEQVEQKATNALNRLEEAELKLAETANVLTVRDKEFVDYKREEKA